MHLVELLTPKTLENVPEGQLLQKLAALTSEYVPARHFTQYWLDCDPSLLENVPGKHDSQKEIFEAPNTVEYLPAGHREQYDALATSEYFPESQVVHEVAPDVNLKSVPGTPTSSRRTSQINAAALSHGRCCHVPFENNLAHTEFRVCCTVVTRERAINVLEDIWPL